jgi:uncharacterized membrane protein
MPRAEVTWNGTAKSYRVGTEVFHQNRSRTEDWPEETVKYLEATKGFSVVRKEAAPAPAKAAPAKAEATEPEATEPEATEETPKETSKPSSSRRPRRKPSS